MPLLAFVLLGAVALALVAAARMVASPGRDPGTDPVMVSAIGLTCVAEIAGVVLAMHGA